MAPSFELIAAEKHRNFEIYVHSISLEIASFDRWYTSSYNWPSTVGVIMALSLSFSEITAHTWNLGWGSLIETDNIIYMTFYQSAILTIAHHALFLDV